MNKTSKRSAFTSGHTAKMALALSLAAGFSVLCVGIETSSNNSQTGGSAWAMGPGGTAELDSANRSYIVGDFERGVQYVDLHLKKLPNDGNAHYLKANCLMKLGRLAEASREYALVTKLSPGSVISTYSKNAQKSIEAIPADQRNLAPSVSGARPSSGKVPPGTVELIRFQAARAKEHALESGSAASKDELQKADSQGRSEKERVERLSQSGGARADAPAVSAAELAAMRERAAAHAEYLKQVGAAKAARHEREAQEKSQELERQADDLERQLTDENYNKHRDIKLNPVGTNLYVRNYSQIAPTVKPMRARAESLSGVASSQQTSAQLQSSNTSGSIRPSAIGQGNGSVRRESKVKGEVLPK